MHIDFFLFPQVLCVRFVSHSTKELEDELAEALAEISNTHLHLAEEVEPVKIGLEKTDVRVAEVKLVWVPVS